MGSFTWLVHSVEEHHDFFLVVAALLAASVGPIAAIWIGARQIRASRMTEYRATILQKLRDELAAELFYVSQLAMRWQTFGNDEETGNITVEARAKKMRIRFLVGPSSTELDQVFAHEEALIQTVQSRAESKRWTGEENAQFDAEVNALGNLAYSVMEAALKRAAKS
jgi:hypothetical protein